LKRRKDRRWFKNLYGKCRFTVVFDDRSGTSSDMRSLLETRVLVSEGSKRRERNRPLAQEIPKSNYCVLGVLHKLWLCLIADILEPFKEFSGERW